MPCGFGVFHPFFGTGGIEVCIRKMVKRHVECAVTECSKNIITQNAVNGNECVNMHESLHAFLLNAQKWLTMALNVSSLE